MEQTFGGRKGGNSCSNELLCVSFCYGFYFIGDAYIMYDIIKSLAKRIGGSDVYVLHLVNEMGSPDFGRKREMDGTARYL